MLINMSTYCRACREYSVHCMNTKIFPVVPRHTLVLNISVFDCMVGHNKCLKPPKRILSLILVFLRRPVQTQFSDFYHFEI